MGYKHWNKESLPEFELDRYAERLEEAKKKEEERKKADKERIENIKYCWLKYGELSKEDISWLVWKVERGMG